MHGNRGRAAPEGWAWRGHPFHPENNINGINAGVDANARSGEVHSLANPAANAIQAAYIRKVVDTVNDLDNVLYEVINEGGQKEWDWWVVQTVREHERTRPKQHPVGITGHGAERLVSMLARPADWISPGRADGYGEDPPAWEGQKVSLLDTDHIWGVGGTPAWAWKSFVRGMLPNHAGVPDRAISRIGKFGGDRECRRAEQYAGKWTQHGPDPRLLMGARTTEPANGGADWICVQETHWLFAGTGLRTGDRIPGLVGWEHHGEPADLPGLEVVARGPVFSQGRPQGVEYTAVVLLGPKGNLIFNAATIWWSDGLSAPPGYVRPSAHGNRPKGPDPRVQRMTANLLERFLT